MSLGKAFLVWATLFVIGQIFSNGSQVPNDPVFDCLNSNTRRALHCYKTFAGFEDSYEGGVLGNALKKLLPNNYKSWPKMVPVQRALQCTTALKNFVQPLRVVLQSEKRTKFVCPSTGHTLKKTLNETLQVLENSIKDIDRYAQHRFHFNQTLRVSRHVDMNRMTYLAAQMSHTSTTGRYAVQLRNYVLLDFLDRLVTEIKWTARSCFNTQVTIGTLTGCTD